MGPFFVYVLWESIAVPSVYSFNTAMEARAFYYGMRTMLQRASDHVTADRDTDMTMIGGRWYSAMEYRRYFGLLHVRAMCMDVCGAEDFNDRGVSELFGHHTIYDASLQREAFVMAVKVAIEEMEEAAF